MLKRLPLLAFVAVIVAACSKNPPPTTLSFNPEDGEQKRYQIYSDTTINAQTRRGKRTERLNTMMLLDYLVDEKSDSYHIQMKPQYINMKFPHGHFRSFDKPEDNSIDTEVRAMMEAGFTVEIEKKSNKMQNFVIHQESEKLRNKGFDPIKEMLNDEFGRPGFISDLKIESGAEQVIQMQSPLPAISVTVKTFTDNTVKLLISGENDKAKVFGFAVLDRYSGWTNRLTIVIDMPLPKQAAASEGSVRMVTSIFPENWMFGQNLDFLSRAQSTALNTTDFSQEADKEMASNEAVFANNGGKIKFRNDLINLSYSHPKLEFEQLGNIKIKELTAKDKSGEPLDINMHYNGAFTYHSFRGDNLTTAIDLYPMGWKNMAQKIEQIGSIEAKLARYTATHEIVELPIDKAGTSIEKQGATATLIPTQDERVFDLKITSTDTAYFNTEVNGVSAGSVKYDKSANAPDWLKEGESRLIAVTKAGNYPITMQLAFADELPDAIELKLTHFTDEKLSEKQIIFYDEETLNNNSQIAPIDSTSLYAPENEDKNERYLEFTTSSMDNLEPKSFGRPQLYVTLTPEQASVCYFQLKSNAKEGSNALVMKENTDPNNSYKITSLQMPRKAVYQLMTEDGVRKYFYEKKVDFELNCEGKPSWQTLDIHLAETNWMIPVESLLGEQWQKSHANTPMNEFLRSFRFLDKDGTALAVLPTNSSDKSVDYFDTQLKEFVSADGYLRIAGRVDKVDKLIVKGQPVKKQWTHQFPNLPDIEAFEGAN